MNNSISRLLDKLPGVRRAGPDSWRALCPAHDDRKPSLNVAVKGGKVLVHCFAGCAPAAVLRAVGLTWADLSDEPRKTERNQRQIAATYDYVDRGGRLLFQVVRFEPKGFAQRRPDGQGGWAWDLKGVPRVLYRLGEVLEAAGRGRRVYVVEGEKDADNLAALGVCATCNPGGAGKWRDEFSDSLAGAHVVILPDNDKAGRKHAQAVAASLRGKAASVKVLALPGLPEGGDVSDWLARGGTREQLEALADRAPEWSPAPAAPGGFALTDLGNAAPKEGEEGRSLFARTDAGNAELFAERYGSIARYVHQLNTWRVWTGKRWADDVTGKVEQLALLAARDRLARAAALPDDFERREEAKWALRSESVDKRRDLLAAASTMPELACLPGDFDGDPWLLNCANGLLDLRTGRLRPHDPAAMCSKLAGAAYEPEAKCPGWERFLAEVFDGDEGLILYVQLAVGYCLTGSTAEDCFFLCHGGGRNGKSTFLRVLRDLFGDYAAHTDFATLTIERERQAAIRNDIARLAGARLVTAIETSEGVRFAEGVVKALTGGDPVTARFLHKEFFEFDPQFKLWLGCNHKPRVRDTSEAFWRRVRLLPFEVQFSGDRERNREELLAELRAELPGILAWAVCGCLAWQEVGRLPLPDRVRAATEGYRVEEDVLSQFLADSCLTGPGLEVGASDLYQAYCEWCAANGEHPLSQTRFGRALGEKGFAKARNRTARWEYRGLGLLADDD